MTEEDKDKLGLSPESADAVAALAKEQRAWVLGQLQASSAAERPEQRTDRIRIKVRRLLHLAGFLEKLSRAKELQEVDHLLHYELPPNMDSVQKEYDLNAFPHYEKIVTDALMHALSQANLPTGPSRIWLRAAITIKIHLGRGMTFNDSKIPGYSDAWKSAFIHAIQSNDSSLALAIDNVTAGEVNLREIPNYESLVKARYYDLMFRSYSREDEVLAGALGAGIDFFAKEQKIVERMAECLNDVRDWSMADIFYILKKFNGVPPADL